MLPPSLPELGHLTVNPSDAVVVACAWPDFFGGAPASPLTEAPPGRRCDANIAGVRSKEAVNPDAPPEGQVFRWTFDLSTFAAQWAGGVNPAISLEPDPSRPSGAPWITTFHAAAVRAPDGTPGIQAKVTWVPPADGGDGPISAGSGSMGGSGFGFPSAATDAPPAPAEPTVAVARQPRPTPSVAARLATRLVGLWDLPFWVWAASALGLLVLLLAGLAVQRDPPAPRPAGAASALMRGTEGGAP